MTRTLKVRAWDTKRQRMYTKVELLISPEGTHVTLAATADGIVVTPPDEDIELMYTMGITDKRGRDIFEGDYLFLGLGKHRLEVRWGVVGYRLFDIDAQQWHLLWAADMKRLEIIGNIYETPQLLEVQS
jgi:hypothetical protein